MNVFRLFIDSSKPMIVSPKFHQRIPKREKKKRERERERKKKIDDPSVLNNRKTKNKSYLNSVYSRISD